MQPRINDKSRKIAAQSTDKETSRAGTLTQAQISKLLHQPSQKKIMKREEIRQKSLAKEVKDCSFKPTINADPLAKHPSKQKEAETMRKQRLYAKRGMRSDKSQDLVEMERDQENYTFKPNRKK